MTQPEPIIKFDSIERLEAQVKDLEAKLQEKSNQYLYLYSDFENFKRRMVRERSELIRFGWEPLAMDFLEIIDNLERALSHMPKDSGKALIDGLHMVLKQFKATLEKQGVRHIETAQKAFDPEFHEAVAHIPSEHPSGTILKEHVRGYRMHDRLLRPSKVVVSSGQPREQYEEEKIKEEANHGKNNRH